MSAVKRYPLEIELGKQQDSGDRIVHEHRRGISRDEGVDPPQLDGREQPLRDEIGDQQGEPDCKGKPFLRPAGRQAREDEILFLWDNGGCLHHRSNPSQRLERAARSSYRFATLIPGCLSSPPFRPLGRLTTSKQASRPVKRLDWQDSCGGACDRASDRLQNAFFGPSFRFSPARLVTQRDISLSHLWGTCLHLRSDRPLLARCRL